MPLAERPVVVDATPIVALAGLARLDLLRDLYGEVVVPPAVWQELLRGGTRAGGLAHLEAAPWIRVANLQEGRGADLFPDLDRGEAEVIVLALELDARLVVIDDRLGRHHAHRLGLRLTGTVGLLLHAKTRGLVERIAPYLDQLDANRIFLSEKLRAWALGQSGEG